MVTATEDDENKFHGNTLWFVPDAAFADAKAVQPVKVAEFESKMKAEGLAELPGATADEARLVITYDNDAHSTKTPSMIQVVTISRAK